MQISAKRVNGMRTTLDIDSRLLAKAKAKAALENKSLTRLIEESLALNLRAAGRRIASKLPVFVGSGGMHASIDPSSNRSLLDAVDDRS
jgi:hypothetical protein